MCARYIRHTQTQRMCVNSKTGSGRPRDINERFDLRAGVFESVSLPQATEGKAEAGRVLNHFYSDLRAGVFEIVALPQRCLELVPERS